MFAVTKLDRLARSVADLCRIVAELKRKGVTLRILDLGMDTSTPTGKLILQVIDSIAEFEREIMLKGSAKASRQQRRPAVSKDGRRRASKIGRVRKMASEGLGKIEIAERLGISERSVYRILAAA